MSTTCTDEKNNKDPVTLGNVSCSLSLCVHVNSYNITLLPMSIFVFDLMPLQKRCYIASILLGTQHKDKINNEYIHIYIYNNIMLK